MQERNRVKLLFGPYRMPRCAVGRLLRCRIRGKVRVRGISDGPIQWPCTRKAGGGGKQSLILCGDLVRAVQRESEIAVAHWWGVGISTVWTWRTALGVDPDTEGHLTCGGAGHPKLCKVRRPIADECLL